MLKFYPYEFAKCKIRYRNDSDIFQQYDKEINPITNRLEAVKTKDIEESYVFAFLLLYPIYMIKLLFKFLAYWTYRSFNKGITKEQKLEAELQDLNQAIKEAKAELDGLKEV